MDIQVPSSEVKPQGYVLAPHEMESLQAAYGAHAQILGASDSFANALDGAGPVKLDNLRVNRKKLSEQAQAIKKTLDQCSPQPTTSQERDKLDARRKVLETKFLPWLETRAELNVKKRDRSEWTSAMEKAMKRTPGTPAYDPSIEAAINEWKYIKRRLEPGNPAADNLHSLRKDR